MANPYTLYYTPGSCAMAVHIDLIEAGLPYQLNLVKDKKTQDGRDFLTINPLGYVPALEIENGTILTEGVAIASYLAHKAPSKLSYPMDDIKHFQVNSWLVLISTELHKNFGALFAGAGKVGEQMIGFATDRLTLRLRYLEQHLKGKTFLVGDRFTAADAYLSVVLSWAGHVKFDLSGLPNIQAYMNEMHKRPSFLQAKKEEFGNA